MKRKKGPDSKVVYTLYIHIQRKLKAKSYKDSTRRNELYRDVIFVLEKLIWML